MSDNKYRVPAVDKALDILEFISQSVDPITLSLLCRELNKSPNELFRVVNCLEKRGYILKNENANSFTLSMKLFELAHFYPPLQKMLHAAQGPMATFGEEIGLSSHLSILEKGDMINLYEQEGSDPVSIHVKMGSHFPAIVSNSGKFLVALLDDEKFNFFLEHDETYQNFEKNERKKILKELTFLRKKEFSVTASFNTPGVVDAIVPLGNENSGLQATLAVPFFKKLTDPDKLIENMLITVKEINRRLGFK